MLSADFLHDFKRRTEERWWQTSVNTTLYGFQFQQGTRWLPGLSAQEIGEYETALGVRLPDDFKRFLAEMNGTDLPTLNVYGSGGQRSRQSVGVFSYPRDLGEVRRRIEDVEVHREELAATLSEQGFDLGPKNSLLPIFDHRYVVGTSDLASSVVLSIEDGTDAIVYGDSIQEYLRREFLDERITKGDSGHLGAPSGR